MFNSNTKKIAKLSIDTIRMLSVEAISAANSGHPGIALGAAPIMYALFKYHLVFNPKIPNFFNRDRFVLSAGHGSALLYSTMLVFGYDSIKMDDLKNFRQLNSKTAGHPENILLPGVEVSTGPLGQGVAMAVGMALAEQKLAHLYNKRCDLIDHYTYCLFGDGCMEEGVFYEAISIAGKYKLNKLILLYDSNNIQLDGKVQDSTNTKIKTLFKSVGWNYIKVANGNNYQAISNAIARAKTHKNAPTIIEIKTTIGYGTQYKNSNSVHGSPLKENDIAELRKKLNYKVAPFKIHSSVTEDVSIFAKRGFSKQQEYNKKLNLIESVDTKLYDEIINATQNKFNFLSSWYNDAPHTDLVSTRKLFGDVLQKVFLNNHNVFVLNADLSSSTKITAQKTIPFSPKFKSGQILNVGVREFAMCAIENGIVAHGGIKAFGSTFLSFSDYLKPAIRLAAISHIQPINVFSHDSIMVGEDGPTHQPIEQISTLRMIPNHILFRPCNLTECLVALYYAMSNQSAPISIITSRHDFKQHNSNFLDAVNGAYVIKDTNNHDVTLIASGAEVDNAIRVSKILEDNKINARVVSANSMEIFLKQDQKYIEKILDDKPKISIEFGSTYYWSKFCDYSIGIDTFGKSGKPGDLLKYFKLTDLDIANKIIKFLKK